MWIEHIQAGSAKQVSTHARTQMYVSSEILEISLLVSQPQEGIVHAVPLAVVARAAHRPGAMWWCLNVTLAPALALLLLPVKD